ncbi:TetR/AcrR family transcriptional regulator [Dyadobacter frigoris]|uniref:TetR/AcrR family transcriptional regulator n=1 Tax=Dyadobacter frigoris TaxID=2576211 RepID=A0A4U6CWY6_9BACT|nr:TetR/AcrR family transcriptional regulator [Dyadobacter frigoris]TKT88181.1 TetR/AcrR family transcriptional regulator [Dyadobacter frigoris]GLU53799.1 TetR family transcriptional regulator [Dyadobacter frigoris]
MKARTDTKEKIVELATDLILAGGYPSLSYQQISSKLGIKNAAIHYHYPSKEDLGVEVVRKEIERFDDFMAAVSGFGQWEKLEAFMLNYRKYLENENRICMIGACASDYREIPEQIQSTAAEYFQIVKNWFTDLLESGRSEKAFYFRGEAANKASLISSAMAGGLQHARLIGNAHYDAVITQIKLELQE